MIKNRDYLCWLAGFYEGEGSCGFYSNCGENGRIQISVSQNEKEPLLEIKEKFGFGNVSKSKDSFQYFVSGESALKFIFTIAPYLRTDKKKMQIEKALLDYVKKPANPRAKSPLKSAIALSRKRDERGNFV